MVVIPPSPQLISGISSIALQSGCSDQLSLRVRVSCDPGEPHPSSIRPCAGFIVSAGGRDRIAARTYWHSRSASPASCPETRCCHSHWDGRSSRNLECPTWFRHRQRDAREGLERITYTNSGVQVMGFSKTQTSPRSSQRQDTTTRDAPCASLVWIYRAAAWLRRPIRGTPIQDDVSRHRGTDTIDQLNRSVHIS